MKALIKIIAAFIVIFATFIIIDAVFGRWAERLLIKGHTKQEYVMSTMDNHDIVFFGSSRANHHYDTPYITDSLGLNAFNAGEDGRGMTYQVPLISAYLEKNSPRLVVIEVFGNLDGTWNDRISLLYPLANKYPGIVREAEMIDPNNTFYLKSSLFRHNSNLIPEIKALRNPFRMEASRGYSPLAAAEKAPPLLEIKDERILPSDSIEIQALKNILNECKEKNIPVVGVISPLYTSDKMFQLTDSIFTSYGYPFLDNSGYRLPASPEKYFNDAAHMNEVGAREYTKYFMSQITDSLNLLSKPYPNLLQDSVPANSIR